MQVRPRPSRAVFVSVSGTAPRSLSPVPRRLGPGARHELVRWWKAVYAGSRHDHNGDGRIGKGRHDGGATGPGRYSRGGLERGGDPGDRAGGRGGRLRRDLRRRGQQRRDGHGPIDGRRHQPHPGRNLDRQHLPAPFLHLRPRGGPHRRRHRRPLHPRARGQPPADQPGAGDRHAASTGDACAAT